MRRANIILLITITLISSFFNIEPILAKVLISRIQIGGVSTTDEFVELYNYASSSQNITNWSLRKVTSGGSNSYLISQFPESTILNPFSYYLVSHRDYTPINGASADLSYTNASTILAANNSLILQEDTDLIADEVGWGSVSTTIGSPCANPPAGASLTRLPNDETGNFLDSGDCLQDFVEIPSLPRNSLSIAQPGTPTIVPTTSTSSTTNQAVEPVTSTDLTNIKINEFVPNPESGDEWIELYNSGSESVLLNDNILCDARSGDSCTILTLSGEIAAHSWKTFYLEASKLNNDGDSLILKSSSGVVFDEVSYGGATLPGKAESLARSVDGAGEWKISTSPTPDVANIIIERPLPAPAPILTGSSGGSYWEAPLLTTKKISSPLPTLDKINIFWNVQVPKTIYVNSSTYFDAHLSADPRGGEIMYSWNFGDGNSLDGSRVYHTFTTSGIFTVTIAATSTQGTTGTKSLNVQVYHEFINKTGVYIDSILARPTVGDEEWVALRNNSSSSTDLSSWKIMTDSGKSYSIPIKTVLNPGGLLRFYKSITKLPLTDDGGSLILSNASSSVVDIFNFTSSKRGEFINASLGNTEEDESNLQIASIGGRTPASTTTKTTSGFFTDLMTARNLPTRTKLTTTGIVTSLPGSPYATYFYLSDASGGIQIYSYKKSFPNLKLGDRISVSGEISSSNGVPRIKISSPSSIKIISTNNTLPIYEKNISEIDDSDFGKLIKITGDVTDILSASFYLDDTTGETLVAIPGGTKINKKDLRVGQNITLIGIIEKSGSGSRITPRNSNDLIINEASNKMDQNDTKFTNSKPVLALGGAFIVGLAIVTKRWLLKK